MGVYKAVTNFTDSLKTGSNADFCYWITTNPLVMTKVMIHQQVTFPTPFSDLVRAREYQIKSFTLDGNIIGYVVLEFEDYNGYSIGSIFDLFTFQDRVELVTSIFKKLVEYFDTRDIECISMTTMRGHPYHEVATSIGFFNATYASDSHVRFWGYNDNFYKVLNTLKPDRIYFSYSDFY